jgi:DNA repair protein RAD16
VCHLALTIDLEAPALELEANVPSARQGILGRLNLETWRSSSKIEALVEELSNLRLQDHTTKSIVFSQFVNFLDLIAFRLQKAGFSVRTWSPVLPMNADAEVLDRSVDLREPCPLRLAMRQFNTLVRRITYLFVLIY